jgi:hypothetical protein
MPFLPYSGFMELLTARFTRPVVLALIDRLILGVRIPNFIAFSPLEFE